MSSQSTFPRKIARTPRSRARRSSTARSRPCPASTRHRCGLAASATARIRESIAFSGASLATESTATSSGASPIPARRDSRPRRAAFGGGGEALRIDRVREHTHLARVCAARHERAARERAGDEHTRRAPDDAPHDGALHGSAPCCPRPMSWLSTCRTNGTRRATHHAIAAWEAKVLQPVTTTTCGRCRRSTRTISGVTG